MKSEIELILLGSLAKRTEDEENRFQELISQKQDWAFITGELIRHRLNGNFLSSITKEQSRYMVSKVWATFKLLSDCYQACNLLNLKFFEELISKTDAAGIKIAGLKGIVYNASIYPLNARKSNDLDVLVKEKDLKIFDAIMRDMGFIQSLDGGRTEASRREKMIQLMNYHDLVPYFKRVELPYFEAYRVDVNFHFDSKDHDITEAILEDGLQDYSGNGFTVRGLNKHTHLLHLCVHFYREASNAIWTSTARDVDLYKIVDVENTMRSESEEDLLKWCEYVDKYDLRKQCYFTLYYLNRFYPKPFYEVLMERIRPDDVDYLDKVNVAGGETRDRGVDFFEKTFDMNYGKSFQKDLTKVF